MNGQTTLPTAIMPDVGDRDAQRSGFPLLSTQIPRTSPSKQDRTDRTELKPSSQPVEH